MTVCYFKSAIFSLTLYGKKNSLLARRKLERFPYLQYSTMTIRGPRHQRRLDRGQKRKSYVLISHTVTLFTEKQKLTANPTETGFTLYLKVVLFSKFCVWNRLIDTHTPLGLVHAPSRLTTLRWFPMWMRIFSSDMSALCSLAVAPSVPNTTKTVPVNVSIMMSTDCGLQTRTYLSTSWRPLCLNWFSCHVHW